MRVDQRQALATLAKPGLQELAAAFELDVPARRIGEEHARPLRPVARQTLGLDHAAREGMGSGASVPPTGPGVTRGSHPNDGPYRRPTAP